MLKTAPDEYDDAVAKDRIVHPVGYRTARGFILAGGPDGRKRGGRSREPDNPDALREMREALAQLKQAFAAVTAPKRPPIDETAMLAIVSRVELAAAKLQ